MVIGYIRASKTEKNQDLQFDSLKKAGCEKINHLKKSGASMQGPEYLRMISELRKGDVIVVWRIDRLGRTTLRANQADDRMEENGSRLSEYFRRDLHFYQNRPPLVHAQFSLCRKLERDFDVKNFAGHGSC